ncbi:MAG: hypothetical protein IJ654_03760 [Bacteroidales bacterium]|nr:hypothetical protein [Bacteroidales bacterium]
MTSHHQILFSERNGYAKPSEVLIVGDVPQDVANAISSALTRLMQTMDNSIIGGYTSQADELGQYIWTHLMGKSLIDYKTAFHDGREAIAGWIQSMDTEWFRKLDLIEFVLARVESATLRERFISELTERFESLGFGYRILNGCVVDTVSEPELKAIDDAILKSRKAISNHLAKALELHTKRPKGDYVNSIKESISAVEAMVRLDTGELNFKDAVKALKKKSIQLQPRMEEALIKLYAYTNQPDTGIRHPLMETDSNYVPTSAESLYMLITCSALVNYVKTKKTAANK